MVAGEKPGLPVGRRESNRLPEDRKPGVGILLDSCQRRSSTIRNENMIRSISHWGVGSCAVALVILAMTADAGAQNLEKYRVYDLGPILGGPLSEVHFSINNRSQAVFHSYVFYGGGPNFSDQSGYAWLPTTAYGLQSQTVHEVAALAGLTDDTLAVDIN